MTAYTSVHVNLHFQLIQVLWSNLAFDTALLRFIGNVMALANEFSQNGIYYNGWDRSNESNPASASCIHHPVGDVKKITVDNSFTMSEKELIYEQYTMVLACLPCAGFGSFLLDRK